LEAVIGPLRPDRTLASDHGGGETEMEAASTRFRMVIAIVATIVVGAATFQTLAPGAGEPARMPAGMCPPTC
jgi:hypothetical protein